VHVHGERRRRSGGGQPRLLAGELVKRESEAAELDRHERPEVAGLLQLRKVFDEEPVLAVITGSAGVDAGKQVGAENGHPTSFTPAMVGRGCHSHGPDWR